MADTAPVESEPVGSRVFLVQGRNYRLNGLFEEVLRSLGLVIVGWNLALEAAGRAHGPNPFLWQILAAGFEMADGFVVLMTPDDIVELHPDFREQHEEATEGPSLQPRPNVLLEAGMALALHPDRTVLVQIGNLRGLSDISGRYVVRFDGTPVRRAQLVGQLRAARLMADDPTPDRDQFDEFAGLPTLPAVSSSVKISAAAEVIKAAANESLETRILRKLLELRREQVQTSTVISLDVEQFAESEGVPAGTVRAQLAEMLALGVVEPYAATFGHSAEDGACRITARGIEALRDTAA